MTEQLCREYLIEELKAITEVEHRECMEAETAEQREYHAGRRDAFQAVLSALQHGTPLSH
jgi:hypothetical protein